MHIMKENGTRFVISETDRSLYEIEVALAKTDYFNFVRNITKLCFTAPCNISFVPINFKI